MATRANEDLISVKEAAKECGRNTETVRRWIWDGKLPAEKLGNQLFIKNSDLKTFCRETAAVKYNINQKLEAVKQLKRLRESVWDRIGCD